MTNRLNTQLKAGMLAGVTIVAGAAAADAASMTETSTTGISIFFNSNESPTTGTLVFNGFTGTGTLTGVVMTLNSDIYGPTGEGVGIDGTAAISLAGATASQAFSVNYTTQGFNIAADLLTPASPFDASLTAGDFTGPTVTFALSASGTSLHNSQIRWTGDAATLEYIYTADVPLPAALPLMAIGLGALGFAARRRA